MYIRFFLLCWFCIGSVCLTFGQEYDLPKSDNLLSSVKQDSKKHTIFWNLAHLIDPNGSSLQFGYNYQFKPSMDFQLELGFVSDNLVDNSLPFEEYAGFRIRPQIKFLNKKSLLKRGRWYGGIMLSYQQLTFRENKNFRIDNSFNQRISYRGNDQLYGWYLTTGLDTKFSSRLFFSFSLGIGQVFIDSKGDETDIPLNAILQSECAWFCGRSEFINIKRNRPGFLLDLKFGYLF